MAPEFKEESFGSISIDALADAVALRLAGVHGASITESAVTKTHPIPPSPAPRGKVVPIGPKARSHRVRFDEEELEHALTSKGLGISVQKISDSPVEVKLIMALLLGVGLSFESIKDAGGRDRYGFENPLVEDPRVDTIASHFGTNRERLGVEVASAPDEMLAVLLMVAELCLKGSNSTD